MTKRDFTFAKYVELCEKMLNSDLELLTVEKYLTINLSFKKKALPKKYYTLYMVEDKPDKFIILRHDVDDGADLPYALAMARREAELGISATYYFRVNEEVFKPEIISEVVSSGHEIGYHYDVMDKANADLESVKDVVSANTNSPIEKMKSTEDVIRMINKGDIEQMCILAHPERWSDSFKAWLKELVWQNVKNAGKAILVKRSSFYGNNRN